MRERGILFSGEMVRAILDGRKTQTRRIIKPQPEKFGDGFLRPLRVECPYGWKQDRLWARETWRMSKDFDDIRAGKIIEPQKTDTWGWAIDYLADEKKSQWGEDAGKIRPSIFMPRWASRITLEITNVRVERLQDISEEDVIAEGVIKTEHRAKYGLPEWPYELCRISPIDAYQYLWESINGRGSWEKNPWVWVIEFLRMQA